MEPKVCDSLAVAGRGISSGDRGADVAALMMAMAWAAHCLGGGLAGAAVRAAAAESRWRRREAGSGRC